MYILFKFLLGTCLLLPQKLSEYSSILLIFLYLSRKLISFLYENSTSDEPDSKTDAFLYQVLNEYFVAII